MVTALDESGLEAGLHLVGMGGLLDATDILPGRQTYSMSATCLGPATIALIKSDTLRRRMEHSPSLTLALLSQVSVQMRMLEDRYRLLQCRDVYVRTVHVLLQLVHISGSHSAHRIVLPFLLKRAVLARIVGTSRETISRVMAGLRRNGLVLQSDHQVTIPNLARLRDVLREGDNARG